MLRIALVSYYDKRRSAEFPIRHALSAMRLGAYISKQEAGWTVRLRAFEEAQTPAEIAAALIGEGFDVICLPAYIWTKGASLAVARTLASASTPLIVIGGPETRSMAIDEWPATSIFVVGQGEQTLHRLCRMRADDNSFSGHSLDEHSDLPAFSMRRARPLALQQATPSRSMLRLPHGLPLFGGDFDRLLEGDAALSDFTWYETARGCIYTCSFCGHNTLPFFATFDLDFVEDEIKLLRQRGFRRVFLIDPILGGRPARGKDVLRLFRKLAPDIALTSYMRPEFLDEEFVALLAQSNVAELLMGLQTTNPAVPQHVRGNNIQKIMRYVPGLSARGVKWRAELIVGLPGDTLTGLHESMRFVIDELRPTSLYAYHLTAIPETKLFDLVNDYASADWIEIDDRSHVVAARSYGRRDLREMLAYAGALTSLYNQTVEDEGGSPSFARLHHRAREAVSAASNPEGTSFFYPLNMTAAKAMWRSNVAMPPVEALGTGTAAR